MTNESYTNIINGSPVVPELNGINEQTSGATIILTMPVPRIQEITMTAPGLQLRMPNATLLSNGSDFVVINAGPTNTFAVADSSGGVIQSIGASAVYYVYLRDNQTGAGTWAAKAFPSGAGAGTVTSVGLALPAEFTVTNSPVTTTGSLTAAWAAEASGLMLASPAAASGTPTFRAIAQSDLPVMTGDSGAGGAKGAVPAPAVGDAAKYLRGDGTWAASASSGGASATESFVVMASSAALSNERVLTAGSGMTLADGGAGSTVTLSVTNRLPAPSGSPNLIPIVNNSATAYTLAQIVDWANYMIHI